MVVLAFLALLAAVFSLSVLLSFVEED